MRKFKIIYLSDQFFKRFTFGIFISATLILIIQLSLAIGLQKGMNIKVCASPIEIQEWNKLLDITTKAYDGQIRELEARLVTGDEEAKYWKDSYLWLKKQNEEITN
jgi:hypothetical protein